MALSGAKAVRGARGARAVRRALPWWQLLGRAPVRLRARARGPRARAGGLTRGSPRCASPQETPPPDDFVQSSGKFVAQFAPLVAFSLAVLMLLNLLVVQPLKESQVQAQEQVKLALAQTKESQVQAQEQVKLAMAQTQAQLSRIQATLEEVPRLAGKVDILEDNSRSLLSKR
jgi:hypothetical protein